MFKIEARKLLLQKRQNLSLLECVKWDDLLLIQLQKLDWSKTKILGSYYPIEKFNEPNTILLTQYLMQFIPNLMIAYPVLDKISGTMKFYKSTNEFDINTWGLHEPLKKFFIPKEEIDTFFVPLLGFDLKGHRIGFGKGFYDTYFSTAMHTYKRVGLSYFDPLPKIQDTHEFDVPLTHCITPWHHYEFE